MTHAEADIALSLLNSGKYLETSNEIAEDIFFDIWTSPNFHTSDTDETLTEWPVTGYHYDVLIGGQWPGEQTEWDDGLHGYTMELAFPVTMANDMLKRVRELFDAQYTEYLINMTATYRSGIVRPPPLFFPHSLVIIITLLLLVGFRVDLFRGGSCFRWIYAVESKNQ